MVYLLDQIFFPSMVVVVRSDQDHTVLDYQKLEGGKAISAGY